MVMDRMITRNIEKGVRDHLSQGKAVLIFGARRVGKTVLVRNIINTYEGRTMLLNGEDFDVQRMLENRSRSNYERLFQGVDLLAIDEAQSVPEIGRILKLIVDELPYLKVIATGSSSFDLLNMAGEPLVGRCSSFSLSPFSQSELSTVENPLQTMQLLERRLLFGSYPDVVSFGSDGKCIDYLREIVNAYLLKDILAIDGVKSSRKMLDLLRLIAFQVGSEVSFEELGAQLSMSKQTVEKYLDLLQKVFVIFRIGSFSGNLRKEVVKAGKWYFVDSGIRNALISDYRPLSIRQDAGALWENYIISEKLKRSLEKRDGNELYFWRTYGGQEIDLIERQRDNIISAFEIKWGKKEPKIPSSFKEAYPDVSYTVVNRDNYLDYIL